MKLKSENTIRGSIDMHLRKLGELGPMLQGTAVRKYRKCTAKGCPCHSGKKMHPFTVVTTKEEGKTKSLYVPVEMEETVDCWMKNYRTAKKLISEISALSKELVGTYACRARAENQRRRQLESRMQQMSSESSAD